MKLKNFQIQIYLEISKLSLIYFNLSKFGVIFFKKNGNQVSDDRITFTSFLKSS